MQRGPGVSRQSCKQWEYRQRENQRDQIQRQISALTSEGRLSAAILIVLPFALGGIMFFVNPGYLGTLFGTSIGLTMLGAASCLMLAGIFWLKKIVTIDV